MRTLIFENDETLGEIYHSVTFTGSARGSAWMNADAQRTAWLRVLAAAGWGITSLSLSRPTELANDVNFTIVLNAACDGRSNDTLAAGMKASLESSGYADRIVIRFQGATTCGGNPDLVGQASIFQTPPVRPRVTPPVRPRVTPPVYQGGNLATVDIPFPDDEKEGIGWLKGIDTTTWVLIGVAAVLVLKRL